MATQESPSQESYVVASPSENEAAPIAPVEEQPPANKEEIKEEEEEEDEEEDHPEDEEEDISYSSDLED